MTPLLSIIVPVYNVEKYIRKCLDSIFSQGVASEFYEVVVVNDGTPDNSMAIVDEFVAKYDNLVVINQENQGLSVARNVGMSKAKGKYVWFVDSDDWIEKDSLYELFKLFESQKEVYVLHLKNVDEQTGDVKVEERIPFGFSPSIGADYLFYEGLCCPAQAFVMKKAFLQSNNLEFYPNILHEDAEFCIRMMYLAKTIQIVSAPLYCYLIRNSGSIMSSFNIKNCMSFLAISQSLVNFRDTKVLKEDCGYFSARMVFYCLYPVFILLNNRDLLKNGEYKDFLVSYRPFLLSNLKYLFRSKIFRRKYIRYYIKFIFFLKFSFKQGATSC